MGSALLLGLLALAHVYVGVCFQRVGDRIGEERSPFAFVPVLNLALPVQLAGWSASWAFLLLVPGVNLVIWYAAWDRIARRLGEPRAAAGAMLVPFLNLAALARLAGLRQARLVLATAAVLVFVPALTSAYGLHRRERVDRFARELRSGDPRSRVRAAQALAWIACPAAIAVPALAEAVGTDPDAAVRSAAASTLAALGAGARAAFPIVTAALRDEDAGVRDNAAQAVVALAHAVPAIAPVEITVPALLEAARSPRDPRFPGADLADALAHFGAPALPWILEGLRDPQATVRWHAAAALTQMGPAGGDAVPALFATMDDPEWNVRNAAGFAIEHVARPTEAPRLAEALSAQNVEVRYHAARALMWLAYSAEVRRPENDAAVPLLAAATRDPDSDVRRYSVRALGRPGPRAAEAVAALVVALGDQDPEVRLSAVASLGNLGSDARSVLPTLREAQSDSDRQVRMAAREAITKIGRP